MSSVWNTLLNKAQDPASYAPAGSSDVTTSVVPTVIVLFLSPCDGNNCQPPTPAPANTNNVARIRMRTDRIGCLPRPHPRVTPQ